MILIVKIGSYRRSILFLEIKVMSLVHIRKAVWIFGIHHFIGILDIRIRCNDLEQFNLAADREYRVFLEKPDLHINLEWANLFWVLIWYAITFKLKINDLLWGWGQYHR